MVAVPLPDLVALAEGEVVTLFADSGILRQGARIRLEPGPERRPEELKPAYVRWAAGPPPAGEWDAEVTSVLAVADLDPDRAAARHILAALPAGEVAVVRVTGPDGPALSDVTFAARRASFEAALR